MIIDGRAMAQEVLEQVRELVSGFDPPLVMRAITVAPTPATTSYLRAKARAAETVGITFEVVECASDATTEEVLESVRALGADSVIVQLPLPAHIDTEAVLAAIPEETDADALTPAARASGFPVPPVAAAVEEILTRSGIVVSGAQVIIIGKGRLVGEPVAMRLAALGAAVQSFDENTFDASALSNADIIVSGTGVPHLITPDMVKEGVILIDAGSSEASGTELGDETRVVGDIDPSCADKASLYTPVPNGVGPVAVACLMRNAAQLRTGNIQVL